MREKEKAREEESFCGDFLGTASVAVLSPWASL